MKDPSALPDIQKTPDERNIAIDRVGVRNIVYPIEVLDRSNVVQSSVGTWTLTVDLPHHFKGTHMSRFLEALNENGRLVGVEALPKLLDDLRSRLAAETSHVDVAFPYFMIKPAPVTGKPGMMAYDCKFSAQRGAIDDFVVEVVVPVKTLCPCSKEISEYGAHNQRGYVTVKIRTHSMVWLEEIIELVESCASAPLYPVLKRPDEKFVTELAYDNPRFVEDMVREVALRLHADSRIDWFFVECENHESIHAHNAYACLERDKRA